MPKLSISIRQRGVLVKVLVRAGRNQEIGPHLAYLDTGASDTVLDVDIIKTLGVQAGRSAALHVLGREGVSFHDAYDVGIALVTPDDPLRWLPLTVLSGAVYQTGAVAALGRDFLSQFVMAYDGPKRQATLQW